MRVLVVGGGGREHALAWSLAHSAAVDRIFAAPGNAGTAEIATPVPLKAGDIPGIAEFAERESIDLVVVGPEVPLVAGIADELESRGVPVFGPSRQAARIEGSKAWARRLCRDHGIPGPAAGEFTAVAPALEHLEGMRPPYVVKADGLAAGKGVVIAETRDEAERAVRDCLERRIFGDSGATVVLEEFLGGAEVSAFGLTDGRTVLPLSLAQDFKRLGDGDRGPNTGGMGAFSPLPFVDEATERAVTGILESAVGAMAEEGVHYRGLLYAGLMLTDEGPKVLEFNCRFGDPETQVVLPRLESNLGEVLLACVEGNLASYQLSWTPRACVGVVLASGGYPGAYAQGKPIEGLAESASVPGVHVFHSGSARRDGRVVTAGGRVLTVSALGDDLRAARRAAYESVSRIRFEGMTFRRDVAARAAGEA